uniref:Uncharacterized protein TCIL3000_7_3820 n=1 Tax=Trypanosoma congolense (strain IL3000) TaxID=1068625 RepID=G0UQA7_TRYCI|nr:unnamed protein product [Trypanosoma congolense IL3000]
METMLTNIMVTVQSLGRYDVGLCVNEDGTAFTVLQSPHYQISGPAKGPGDTYRQWSTIEKAKQRIERADCRSKERFRSIACAHVQHEDKVDDVTASQKVSVKVKNVDSYPKTTYEQIQELLQSQKRNKKGYRKHSSPAVRCSSAGDGYLLWRYGGSFPKENYYENYRIHGLKRRQQ